MPIGMVGGRARSSITGGDYAADALRVVPGGCKEVSAQGNWTTSRSSWTTYYLCQATRFMESTNFQVNFWTRKLTSRFVPSLSIQELLQLVGLVRNSTKTEQILYCTFADQQIHDSHITTMSAIRQTTRLRQISTSSALLSQASRVRTPASRSFQTSAARCDSVVAPVKKPVGAFRGG